MTDSIFEHLAGITAVILFVWSAALLWATWRLVRALRTLAGEQRELRRWRRLRALGERQRQPWN